MLLNSIAMPKFKHLNKTFCYDLFFLPSENNQCYRLPKQDKRAVEIEKPETDKNNYIQKLFALLDTLLTLAERR